VKKLLNTGGKSDTRRYCFIYYFISERERDEKMKAELARGKKAGN
jgi:hypothetical protein